MKIKKYADWTPRHKKLAIGLAAVVVFYLLFGFIAAPFILRAVLEKKVAAAINRQVSVGAVRVNPLTLSVTLRGLDVRETAGAPFVKLGEAYVNLETLSLFKWALVLKTVRLVDPDVNLVRIDEKHFNFSDIGQGGPAAAPNADAADQGSGFGFVVENFTLSGGRIAFEDRVAAVNHLVEQLNLGVTGLSSRPSDAERDTLFNLSARINDADVSLNGQTRPFAATRETLATLGLASVQVPHYRPYIPLPPGLGLKSLAADLKSTVDFKLNAEGQPTLTVDGVLSLHDLQLTDDQGAPFFNQRELQAELQPSTVLSGQVRLAKIDLTAPEVFLERLPSGELRLPFTPAKKTAAQPPAEKTADSADAGTPPVITVDHLSLAKGVVHFTDRANRTAFSTTVNDLALTVDNFGLNTDRTAKYRLALKTDAGETVSLAGDASLSPLQATGDVALAGIKIPRYAPYYQDRFAFKTLAGALSLGGSYRYRQEKDKDTPVVTLAGLYLDLAGLDVARAADDDPLVRLGKLQVADSRVDLNAHTVTLGRVDFADGVIACRREKDGNLNLAQAFTPLSAADSPPKAEPQTAPSAPAPTGTPWVLNLDALKLAGFTVAVEDRVPKDPVKFKMDAIALSAESFSTAKDHAGQVDLSLKWEKTGQLQVGGKVTVSPLNLELAVKAKQMDVRPFQPYLSEQTGMIVTQGFFNTQGQLKLSQNNKAEPVMTYRGNAGLNQFASIDRRHANDFLKWKALLLDNLNLGVNPTRMDVKQIALSDFFARVIVDSQGNVNLISMFDAPADQTASGQKTAAAKPQAAKKRASAAGKSAIRIDRISMSGGEVDYSDNYIKPHFNARFHDLGGKVTGLESMAEKRADVLLEGMWSKQAPVKITGQINPLIENPYVDLNLNISDIELSPFSPYSGKYLGYILDKGKLTFNVSYLMEDRRLEGKNNIYIDQLTLGSAVKSPQAVNLPIKLAIALLKDRNGNIQLDLPVSGNLNDPKFKIGKVVLTVLKNLIVKIVTSPFAALGALAGGGEELSYLDFAPGVSDISPQNAEKIVKVAKILYERPGLKLDIQGTAVPQADGDALRAVVLENRLKAEKLREMMKSGKSAIPLEDIQLDAEERAKLIEAAFADSGIAVPLDNNGKPVELSLADMEKLLRINTEVTPDDYRALANARAFNTKNYLLENSQVARERLFIVEPRFDAGDAKAKKDRAQNGQVIFSLK